MSDERIHKHEWENGRCKICKASQVEEPTPTLSPARAERDLVTRLQALERRVAQMEAMTLLTWVLFFIYLFVFRKS
jgi:hypothetical protein